MKILIIEDEFKLADTISDILKDENFDVVIKSDGIKGEEEALTGIYDLILLDVMLPKKDGFEILENLKKNINTPIIMLTAKSEITDKLAGLENGAVDYITKPFHMRELIARVKIAIKREKNIEDTKVLEYKDIKLNIKKQELICDNKKVLLSNKEKLLLENLLLNINKTITRELLSEKIWGFDSNTEYNNVEVYVSFLRKKLKEINSNVCIKYIKNQGYKLEEIYDK